MNTTSTKWFVGLICFATFLFLVGGIMGTVHWDTDQQGTEKVHKIAFYILTCSGAAIALFSCGLAITLARE